MQVTSARFAESLHFDRISPFLTSQQRTSSLAPTYARPDPVERLLLVVRESGVQMQFEDAVVMVPKDCVASYFLCIC